MQHHRIYMETFTGTVSDVTATFKSSSVFLTTLSYCKEAGCKNDISSDLVSSVLEDFLCYFK